MKNSISLLTLLAMCLTWGCNTKTKIVDSCGDGFLDPGEECDQDELSVSNCQQLGYYEQVSPLSCREDCTFDLTSCNGRCGDQVMQLMFGEQCDGDNLVLTTNFCRVRGYYGGAQGCSGTCMLDESLCQGNGTCGDGVWQEAYESCEGEELGGATCESLGYPSGTLACGDTCRFEVSLCVGGETCGNGALDDPEQCDGSNLNGLSCADLEGFAGGALSCGPDCRLDMSRCYPETVCGDDVVYGDEQCDGDNLLGLTCAVLGLGSGVLTCGADCLYNTAGCSVPTLCGDGVIHGSLGEQCDGTNMDGQTCQSLGYSGGVLECAVDCTLDMSECTSICGNGLVEVGETCDDGNAFGMDGCSSACAVETGWECEGTPSDCNTICGDDLVVGDEECDGLELNAQTCEGLEYHGGTLTCADDCTLVLADCETAGRCGDGIVQASYEECDVVDLAEESCGTVGFGSGMLACDDACSFDTGGCSMNYESPNIGTLIFVPAGTFQRDATATNLSTVSAFRMSKYEITRAQWMAVTGWADPSYTPYSSGVNDPVQKVSWYDAIAFCNKLSLQEGLTPVYTVSDVNFSTLTYAQIPTATNADWNAATANWAANGYRLPTEMEWMWAAMGADTAAPGLANTTGWSKPFAGSDGINAIGDYAVFGLGTSEEGRTITQRSNQVGSKLPNELGFYDLSGNIWELMWDGAGTWPGGTLLDYRGPMTTNRMLRGGNWYLSSYYCAMGSRSNSANPYEVDNKLGFRVVRP